VTLDQLVSDCLHNVAILAHNVTEGVSDVGIGVGLVMHSEADIHGTIQIGRGFGLAQSRAGDGEIVHADIIGTGGDALGSLVDTSPTVLVLGCVIYLKGRLTFGHIIIIKDDTVVYTFHTISCSTGNLFYQIITIICLPKCANIIIIKVLTFLFRHGIQIIPKIKLDVGNLELHCC